MSREKHDGEIRPRSTDRLETKINKPIDVLNEMKNELQEGVCLAGEKQWSLKDILITLDTIKPFWERDLVIIYLIPRRVDCLI
jgi:hypothetical protein